MQIVLSYLKFAPWSPDNLRLNKLLKLKTYSIKLNKSSPECGKLTLVFTHC